MVILHISVKIVEPIKPSILDVVVGYVQIAVRIIQINGQNLLKMQCSMSPIDMQS